MSDDEEDDDVASAPAQKAEVCSHQQETSRKLTLFLLQTNNGPDDLSSKDTDKAVVSAAPKPSYFSLKAAKHKHGESPTQSIFARGPDRDYESAVGR